MEADHVYTMNELLDKLSSVVTNETDKETQRELKPESVAALEDVKDGVKQLEGRLDTVKEASEKLEAANEDYRGKIAQYAAEAADRIKPDKQDEMENMNPIDVGLKKLKEDEF